MKKTENAPLVSVIIPVFNKELYISASILSVLSQSYKNLELIVIDDGSSDSSKIIIESIAKKDERCIYVYKDNGGVSSARNAGLAIAAGDFVSFLDADDVYLPGFLENMISESHNADVVYCGHYVFNRKTKVKKKCKIDFCNKDFLLNYILNKSTPNTNSWLIRKKIIDDCKLFFQENMSWGEDMLFFANVSIVANVIVPCRKYLTQYNYLNENSLTMGFNAANKISADVFWHEVLLRNINDSNLPKVYKDECFYAIKSYRTPASIIYNLYSCDFSTEVEKARSLYGFYLAEVKDFKFINGIRSFKLFVYLLKLKMLMAFYNYK